MKSALVLGFYAKANLGDEMFKETLPQLVPDYKCTFIATDEYFNPKSKHPPVLEYDAVICGGGDIFNDYFMRKIEMILKNYSGPVFAVGMGIPYPSYINYPANHLRLFDHVFLREKTDLPVLTRRIGGRYAHVLPDLGFLKECSSSEPEKKDFPHIGIFLASPMLPLPNIVQKLVQFFKYLQKFGVLHLIRFNTSGSPKEDDRVIQDLIQKEIPSTQNDLQVYSTDEMIQLMSTFDFAVCTRFHGHIFATIAGCPFISISTTRKVDLYLKEHDLSELQPSSHDFSDLTQTFEKIWENRSMWRQKLRSIAQKNRFLLKTSQINFLLQHSRRTRHDLSIDEIYQSSRKLLFRETGFDPETEKFTTQKISLAAAQKVSAHLCFELTRQPGSGYEHGTTQNLINSPHKLRGMIQWIYQDLHKQLFASPFKIDLKYYTQQLPKVHRVGWNYVLTHLKLLQNKCGVLCDGFLERSFLWGNWSLKRKGIIPYTSMWIGFIHHTLNDLHSKNNFTELLECPEFLQSLPTCQGLICLSDYLTQQVQEKLSEKDISVPVITLYHPTLFVPKMWSPDILKEDTLKLIQVGAWYRNPFTLYSLNLPPFIQKIALQGPKMEEYFPPKNLRLTQSQIQDPDPYGNKWIYYLCLHLQNLKFSSTSEMDTDILNMKNSVQIVQNMDDSSYDDFISQGVVFLNLIDASAANTIVECIVRNIPLLVNRHPAVEEYLGVDYPLFYESLDEIPALLHHSQILKTYEYLRAKDKKFLTIEDFLDKFIQSPVYSQLFQPSENTSLL